MAARSEGFVVTESAGSLASALAQVQMQLPKIGKGSTAKIVTPTSGTYTYSYADLASIHQAVLPLLGKYGLSWMTFPTFDDNGTFVLRYELLHVSGDKREGFYPLPEVTVKAQALGSAITYARRYTISSVIGIAPDDEDDDGAAAQSAPPAVRRTPAREQLAQLTPAQRAKAAVDVLLDTPTVESARKTQSALGDVRDVEVPIVRGLGLPVTAALGLEGESITVGQLAHRVVAYVTKHGMSVREGADAA